MKALFVAFKEEELIEGSRFSKALNAEIDILLAGFTASSGPAGAKVMYLRPENGDAESITDVISTRIASYQYVFACSTMAAKDALPRLSGKIDAPMVSEVIEVLSPTSFKRPIFAGAAIATVEVSNSPIVLTFRPSNFKSLEPSPFASISPEEVSPSQPPRAQVVSAAKAKSGRPDLSQAKVVVSGGKPLKDSETFEKIIGGLADKLGGAVGATRAAVDTGIAPNELQVGQTGKVVAPDLYIAAGISGSTQHVAGIKDSKVIVAINIDPDAPIFEAADIGLVADLFVAVPELTSKLP